MGKIAPGSNKPGRRLLAEGDGWSVADVVCTAGPCDQPFEEQHAGVSIALVIAGTFQYRTSLYQSSAGGELMTPGSMMLGNAGHYFECGHEHATGDRCIAFRFAPEYFERLAFDAGGVKTFRVARLPPLRATAPLIARACAAVDQALIANWEDLNVRLGARVAQIAAGASYEGKAVPGGATARVTRAVRKMERDFAERLELAGLAREAHLSPYHFLRTFEGVTGVTPHQFILRRRLREAARRLQSERTKVLDIALGCGFGDLSNFNHAFRGEFRMTPRDYRRLYFAIL